MNFDHIIIGGGLSGLLCGIRLAEAGQRTALFAAGQCGLNFSGGSIELLGRMDGQDVTEPLEAMAWLPKPHLYNIIGAERTWQLLGEAEKLLADAGIALKGNAQRNVLRITPIGELKPAWRVVEGMACCQCADDLRRRVLVVELEGFMDAATDMLVQGLERFGAVCRTAVVSTPAFKARRNNPTEMRAVNVSRLLEDSETFAALAAAVKQAARAEDDLILLPAVVGGRDLTMLQRLRQAVDARVMFVPTLPPSAVGTAMQRLLRRRFEALGGLFFNGERITHAVMEGSRIASLQAERLADEPLKAKHYVLATGSFLGGGLVAEADRVMEPLVKADVFCTGPRSSWFADRLFDAQPYMSFGVQTDATLHALRGGRPVPNLFAVGSVLCGHNPLVTLDAEGWDIVSALSAARSILNPNA